MKTTNPNFCMTKRIYGALTIIAAVIVIAFISISAYRYFQAPDSSNGFSGIIQQEKRNIYSIPFSGLPNTVKMKLPAISTNDSGVSAWLLVSAKNGSGNIFFGINNALSNPDTQQSARTAALFAANHENISLDSIDITYDIKAMASVIEGPSAGAAMTIATIAALKNKPIRDNVMMTGSINHDGIIGPSGKILEKARVAKKEGAAIFLAPVGSLASIELNYTETEFCREWGGYEYCQPEFVPVILNATKEAGLPIIEVTTIDDALNYFIG